MAIESPKSTRQAGASHPSAWNDRRTRAIVYQILIVGAVAAIGWYLISNTMTNMANRGIATGFSFLDRESGFAIGEHLIPYSAADTYGRAFLVGLLNTLNVALIGIVLATVLGTVIGIARLSSNWLVARLAMVYIEAVRNVPLLLQLFVWYSVITVSLPLPREAFDPLPGVFLSNRGFKVPTLLDHPVYPFIGAALLAGIAAAVLMARWARRRQMRTGRPFPVGATATGLILGLPLLVWVAAGAPLPLEMPELRGFNFVGGLSISPEFAALLLGLTVYTASFIAEIVRNGILAVPRGQTEAALALGLRRGLVLRLVVLPQALRVIIPPTTSQYLNLTKNSSLAVAIGYPDLVSVGNTALNQTGQAIEAITIFMAVYLVISLSISLFMNWYNRRIALVER